jgi:CspA family cold shock protein
MVLTLRGEVLTAQRTGADGEDALFQACEVMARELKAYRARRYRQARIPGPRPRGVVATWFPDRGYGFIRTEAGREVYFNQRSVATQERGAITLGVQVEFEIEEGEKGPQAARVRLRR